MNFNKNFTHNLEHINVTQAIKDAKATARKICEEVANREKDLSQGMAAKDAIGRASFSMLKEKPQHELSQKLESIIEKIGYRKESSSFNQYRIEELTKACTTNGKFDEKIINIADEICSLGAKKAEGLQYSQDVYIPEIVKLCKSKNGEVNQEIYDATVELMKHDKVATRGVPEIIKGCTEYLLDKNGQIFEKFNKKAFEKFRELPEINEKVMRETDDCWTLYMGNMFNAATRKDTWLRDGQEYIFDEVAFNFAKKLYEQHQDILHMDSFMKYFHSHIQEGNKSICDGFKFIPDKNSFFAPKIIESIRKKHNITDTSGLNKELNELCKIDGEYSLHNLLVADTLLSSGKMESIFTAKDIMKTLRGKDGLVPTDAVSYLLRSEKPLYGFHADSLKKCMRPNGTVDGYVYNKVLNGDISTHYIDKCKDSYGNIIYENIDFLEGMYKNSKGYEEYQIRDALDLLKNKDGILDTKLLKPLEEFTEYTHLSPKKLAACLDENGTLDDRLLQLQKDILKKNSNGLNTFDDYWTHTKNPDGSTNIDGIAAIKKLLDAGLLEQMGNNVISAFKTEKGFNLEGLTKFIVENKSMDKQMYYSALSYASNQHKNPIDFTKFKAFKEAASKPEIAPLINDSANVQIINLKLAPDSLHRNWTTEMYELSHLNSESIEILEKNGYPARFYNALAKGNTFKMTTNQQTAKVFDEQFVNGSILEKTLEKLDFSKTAELNYSRETLTSDIKKVLTSLSEEEQKNFKDAFNISIDDITGTIEGFPRFFKQGTTAPTGMEKEFESINSAITKFYTSGVKSESPEIKTAIEEIIKGFPEFSMIIGRTAEDGSRVDIKTLKQLTALTKSPEYTGMSQEDKAISKMTVLLNSLEHVDKKPANTAKHYITDNDGIALNIEAGWMKKSEYANAVLDRYNLSESAKYRITSLLNDLGWSKKYKAGELDATDIAINQRYKGDEIISPLLERIIGNEKNIEVSGLKDAAKSIQKNQEVLMTTTMKELEPYIETKIIDGRKIRYVDLSRPELKDSSILAHFLGYDGNDHTLNLLRNKAYRSGWSASIVRGGRNSSLFAGRNCGIVFESDGVNIANTYRDNIDSGFGKKYNHLKESLLTDGNKDIKHTVQEELKLSNDEYGELMSKIIHTPPEEITDCIINGKRISKEEIIKAHKKGIDNITESTAQNETTVLNPRPIAAIGVGKDLDDYWVKDAINMAYSNDMLLLLKRVER